MFKHFPFLYFSMFLLVACADGSNTNPEEINTPIINGDSGNHPGQIYTPTDAYDYINYLRQSAGLTKLDKNTALQDSAANHANYLINNKTSGHNESSGLPGFTGQRPADRANYTGYLSRDIGEGVATQSSYQLAIDGLFSAIYHRFTLLDIEYDEIGISFIDSDNSSSNGILVHNMASSLKNELCLGNDFSGTGTYYLDICEDENFRIHATDYENAEKTNQNKNPVLTVWPPANSIDIPPAFFNETPDPLPDYSVSGYPISLQFNPAQVESVILSSIYLYHDATDAAISETRLLDQTSDPNFLFSPLEFALYPLERLDWNTRYRVEVEYVINGGSPETKQFSFTTRKPANNYLKISTEDNSFSIAANVATAIYIQPAGPLDIIKSISYSYPQGVTFNSDYIDANTLLLSISGNSGQQVTIKVDSAASSSSRNIIATIE